MTHDGYDHLRESADWARDEAKQNGEYRPTYDTSSIVRMTEAERAAIDKLYPYGEAPLTFDDEGTVMPPKGYTEEWAAYEERMHREMMRQRILIVAAVGAIALAVIIAIAVFG